MAVGVSLSGTGEPISAPDVESMTSSSGVEPPVATYTSLACEPVAAWADVAGMAIIKPTMTEPATTGRQRLRDF
jgi:hypothetical protein